MIKYIYFFLTITLCACGGDGGDGGDSPGDGDPYPFAVWEECSQTLGSNPCNFTLTDQNGDDVSLYDLYGNTIVLDLSAAWCGPCRGAATEVQSVADSYDNLSYVTVLVETAEGLPPATEDVRAWADTYGIQEPVLAGGRDMLNGAADYSWDLGGWPTFYFITDEMVVHTSLRGYSSSYIDMLIQETMEN